MIRGKGRYRKPDPLLVLAALVVLGAVVTTAATAGESFNLSAKPDMVYRASSQDSEGYPLVRLGRAGGELHISLTPPHGLPQEFVADGAPAQGQETLSQVFIFLRYPW